MPVLRLPALRIQQTPSRELFAFAVEGRLLSRVAAVSRVKRDDDRSLEGYQRPEVLSHIAEIREYLESDDAMLPNAIVIAFDPAVSFEATAVVEEAGSGVGQFGHLVIPVPEDDSERKPAWIVDGQQRVAAIRSAHLASFPVFVVGFIARSDEDQREQFILVNATKPLPKGLIYELLPVTDTRLPTRLARRQFPAALMERLNFDEDSPFKGMIQTPTSPEGVVKDNSILKLLENSLSDGILYWLRDPVTGTGDPDAMLPVVKEFWWAAAELFPESWGQAPRRSRLMHGAGIVSLGMLMDAIAEADRREGLPSRTVFVEEMQPLVDVCAWSGGHWEFRNGERRRWNEIQNTSKDITLLADHLLTAYRDGRTGVVSAPASL
jgi:DGQHR domain-containing protein